MKKYLLIYDNNYYKIAEGDPLLFYPDEVPIAIIELTDELIENIIGVDDEKL